MREQGSERLGDLPKVTEQKEKFYAKKRQKGHLLTHVTDKARKAQVRLDPDLGCHENAVSLYFSALSCAALATFSDWLSPEDYSTALPCSAINFQVQVLWGKGSPVP